MIRKAKEAITFIVNVLNPVWKYPVSFASGTRLVDTTIVWKTAAWVKNEEDKKKLAAKKSSHPSTAPYAHRICLSTVHLLYTITVPYRF